MPPKPKKPFVELAVVSATNGLLRVSTAGTAAHKPATLVSWQIVWGDGSPFDVGSGTPPLVLSHQYATHGTYSVTLLVRDSKGMSNSQSLSAAIWVNPPTPIPPQDDAGAGTIVTGPQASITCPVGAVAIAAGSTTASRQTAINGNPDGTAFCLAAGTHFADGPNTPKTGNIFCGEFGAIIDGTGWVTATETDAPFTSTTADNVEIRNLTMQNLPQRAVNCYPWDTATGWLIEYNEMANIAGEGVIPGNNAIIRNNKIHDCYRVGHAILSGSAIFAGGAYPNLVTNVLIEENEMYNFGATQKLLDAEGIIWRRNIIHDSDGPAIWNDGYGDGFIAEYNTLDDNNVGVMFELSFNGIIRNNLIRRSVDQAVFITTSRDTEIYDNVLQDNFRGIAYFVNCVSVGSFPWDPDLRNNSSHDNVIRVPDVVSVLATFLSYSGTCTGGAETPYVNNSKNNNFTNNAYQVADLGGFYWIYGGGSLDWTAWQALPQDAGGSISL